MSLQDTKDKLIALIEKADCIIYKNGKSSYTYGSLYGADEIEFNGFKNLTSFKAKVEELKGEVISQVTDIIRSQKPDWGLQNINSTISSFSALEKLFEATGIGEALKVHHLQIQRDIQGDDNKYSPVDPMDELGEALRETHILADFNYGYFHPFIKAQYSLLNELLSELKGIKAKVQISKIGKIKSTNSHVKGLAQTFSYSDKPVEDIENFLRDTYERITKDVSQQYVAESIETFVNFFKGKRSKSKIKWKGHLNELHYLIDYINKSEYIKFPSNFWELVSVHFVIDGKVIDQEKLKHSNRINMTDRNITSCLPN